MLFKKEIVKETKLETRFLPFHFLKSLPTLTTKYGDWNDISDTSLCHILYIKTYVVILQIRREWLYFQMFDLPTSIFCKNIRLKRE